MLNKGFKVVFTLIIAFALMGTMTFATDANPVTTNTDGDTQAPVVTAPAPDGNTEGDNQAPTVIAPAPEGNAEGENAVLSQEQPTVTGTEGEDVSATDTATPNVKEGDIYQIGDKIEITDAINGNVFVIANEVSISGQIGGDLFVMARTLNLDGAQVYGNVFAVAGTITLNGLVYDLYATCDTLNVPYNGTVYRDMKVVCTNATIDGVIAGNLNITTNSLKLENDCMVYKDLNYTSPAEIEIKDGTVQGNINYNKLTVENNNPQIQDYLMNLAYTLVFTLLVWVVVTFVAPKFKEKIVSAGNTRPLASFGFGLLGLITVPVVAVLLAITVIGVPVSMALIALFVLAITITFTLTTISLSNILQNKVAVLAKAKGILAVLIIAIVLWGLTQIPYAGICASALITIYGFGMFVLAIFNKAKKKEKAVANTDNK